MTARTKIIQFKCFNDAIGKTGPDHWSQAQVGVDEAWKHVVLHYFGHELNGFYRSEETLLRDCVLYANNRFRLEWNATVGQSMAQHRIGSRIAMITVVLRYSMGPRQ